MVDSNSICYMYNNVEGTWSIPDSIRYMDKNVEDTWSIPDSIHYMDKKCGRYMTGSRQYPL